MNLNWIPNMFVNTNTEIMNYCQQLIKNSIAPVKYMNRINVRDNAPSRAIIIYHSRVDKAIRNKTGAYKWIDN